MRSISNLNSVLVKNYAPGSDTLAIIRELKKLGIIKSVAKAKGKSKAKMIEDIKQPSDMVGYTKTLDGSAAVSSNEFPTRLITPGMTQQQIEDINRETQAKLAVLRSEVEQQRLEDIRQTYEPLTRLANLTSERFRGAQEPGAGQRPNSFIQSTTIEQIEDTQDVPMSGTVNEGAPEATAEFATSTFPIEEPETIEVPAARIQPQQKIGGGRAELPEGVAFEELLGTETQKRREGIRAEREKKEITKQQAAEQLGLGKIPTKSSSKKAVTDFYIALTDAMGESEITNATKEEYLAEINKLLEIARKELTV